MKILFAVGGLLYKPTNDLNNLEKTKIEFPGLTNFSAEECEKIRRLEINPKFKKEILKVRKNIGIPVDGLDYDEFKSYYYPFNMSVSDNPDLVRKRNEFNRKVDDEINRIFEEYDCDHFVEKQLKSILLSNVVIPSSADNSDFGGISIQTIFDDDDKDRDENQNNEKAIFIKVTSKVSANAIIKFIEKKRKRLKRLLNNLPKYIKKPLTEDELEIHKMKDGGNKITFDTMEAKMTTSGKFGYVAPSPTLKQNYDRDINVLFRKKRQKNTRETVTK